MRCVFCAYSVQDAAFAHRFACAAHKSAVPNEPVAEIELFLGRNYFRKRFFDGVCVLGLAEAETETVEVGVVSVMYSRFITSWIRILLAIVFSVGLYTAA